MLDLEVVSLGPASREHEERKSSPPLSQERNTHLTHLPCLPFLPTTPFAKSYGAERIRSVNCELWKREGRTEEEEEEVNQNGVRKPWKWKSGQDSHCSQSPSFPLDGKAERIKNKTCQCMCYLPFRHPRSWWDLETSNVPEDGKKKGKVLHPNVFFHLLIALVDAVHCL